MVFILKHRIGVTIEAGICFKGILVDKDAYLLELSQYVVLNPVRAVLVDSPEKWTWSSYRAMMGAPPVPKWLAVDGLLSQFGTFRKQSRRHYQHFVLDGVARDIWEGLRQQIYLGDETFVARMQTKVRIDGDVLTVPQVQRRPPAPSLADIAASHGERNAAIVDSLCHRGLQLSGNSGTLWHPFGDCGTHRTESDAMMRELTLLPVLILPILDHPRMRGVDTSSNSLKYSLILEDNNVSSRWNNKNADGKSS